MPPEPSNLEALKAHGSASPLELRALIQELEIARSIAAQHRRAHAIALDDRERWKKMWHAKVAESEYRWGLCSAALIELARANDARDHYQSAFHDARDERTALAELVTALRGDLYMARERQ